MVISSNVQPYLSPTEQKKFYEQIYRALKKGGKFYTPGPIDESAALNHLYWAYHRSPRADLVGKIVERTFDLSRIPEYRANKSRIEDFVIPEDFGFATITTAFPKMPGVTVNAHIESIRLLF